MTQIALFGTSADPPTAAHQQILNWLSHQYDHVAVWASDNPFKSHQTPLEHRATMLRLSIEAIDPTPTNVQLHQELSHPRALVTVERAGQRWTDANFTLVIGSDLIDQLPRWYCVESLFRQVKILIVPRPGYPLKQEALQQIRELGAEVAIANLRGLRLSSTTYREHKDPGILVPPVEAYIHQKNLYACQNEAQKSLVTPSQSVS